MSEFAPIVLRQLGRRAYEPTWRAMQEFTARRGTGTADEIWLTEHPPIFTLGLAGREIHLRRDVGIPVLKVDRGGQITYHGPGQVVAYVLVDLARRGIRVREMVRLLEQAVLDLLASYGVSGSRRAQAPGVYVDGSKIAALGLRVRRGCCYHGLALNVDVDLAPFGAIDPCGYPGLGVTSLQDIGISGSVRCVGDDLAAVLASLVENSDLEVCDEPG